jgi:signal transduction histidine kinase
MAEHELIESSTSQSAEAGWERWSQMIGDWLPYVTLAISTILSLLQPGQTWTESLGTLALAALSAVWVFLMYTRAPTDKHAQPVRMIVYFGGLLVLASVLMFRQSLFFVFALTGFFQASILKPWSLALAGMGTTSILINTIITGFPWPTAEGWFFFMTIIVVQTFAVGFGTWISNKVAQLSDQRRQMVTSLEAALKENAGLQAQLLAQAREAGVLAERQRLAREIHDTLAQGFIGIITQLGAAQQAKNRPSDWERHFDHAVNLARESLAEARRSVGALRPEPLEDAQLPDALAEVAQHWTQLNGIPVKMTITGEPIALHPEVEAALLRTTQQALANIAKHAHASRVGLTLSYMGDEAMLDVRDDGSGFVVTDQVRSLSPGFGLTSMRQRINQVGGTFSIESELGGGTAISARVPAIAALQETPE